MPSLSSTSRIALITAAGIASILFVGLSHSTDETQILSSAALAKARASFHRPAGIQTPLSSVSTRLTYPASTKAAASTLSPQSGRTTVSRSVLKTRSEIQLSRPQDLTEHIAVPCDIEALGDMWEFLDERAGGKVCYVDDYHGGTTTMTYSEAYSALNTLGAGFQSLGMKKGDRVSLFSDNSHRWLLTDYAILRAGAASAVRGSTAPVDELLYILEHSDSSSLVVENYQVLQKLMEKAPNAIASLKFVMVLFEGKSKPEIPGIQRVKLYTFDEVMQLGSKSTFQKPKVGKDDLASLIYTSGTTGKPKGVMLNHKQFVHQMVYNTIQARASGPLGTLKRLFKNANPQYGDTMLSILPSWHIFERVAETWILARGGKIVFSTRKEFRNDISKWKPQYLVAVPRLYEAIYQGAEKKFNASPKTAKIVKLCKKLGAKYLAAKRNLAGLNGKTGFFSKIRSLCSLAITTPLYKVTDLLVWRKIRNTMGGRIKVALSGGSALPMYVEDFFELAQVPVIVGYGLTETTAPVANRLIEYNQKGTTGTPTSEIRIVHPETGALLPNGEQGLIETRGNQIMAGYYKNPEATKKVMSKDGFFNTGDLGVFNDRGILKITGRQKDTIVLLNGENIEPQPIEEALVASDFIDQVMLVGQDSNFLSAFIVPSLDGLLAEGVIDKSDVKEIEALLKAEDEEGLAAIASELYSRPVVESLMVKEINTLNRAREGFRPDENVRKAQLILRPFTMDNGLLTQTLKVKRNEVAKKYQGLLNTIYGQR